ncbi:MAG: MFS transporter [Pseudomonadota bacterium]
MPLNLTNEWLSRAGPALGFGILLTFGSSFGQTYFLSLFAGELRSEFGLSHGSLGWIYTAATLCSALALLWLGKLADHYSITALTISVLVGLATCAVFMAGVTSWVLLALLLFGLRLGGQGMLGHLALTAIPRWFTRERGRALGIATLGFPAGEALLPIVVAFLLTLITWRELWLYLGVSIVVILVPLLALLGREVEGRVTNEPQLSSRARGGTRPMSWTRKQVLRDRRFFALLPGLLAPPFIMTGVLFHQVHLVEIKGWALTEFGACYLLYAVTATAVSLGCGSFVDRYRSSALLPVYLVPLGLGLALLAGTSSIFAGAVFMTLMGATAGAATIVLGALWAEMYGTDHLGAIRSVATVLMVAATAIAPGVVGWLLDQGINLDWQLAAMAGYTLACALWFALLRPMISSHYQAADMLSSL